MSRHDPKVTLRQIADHARRAQELCRGRTLEQLLSDWQATMAFERALEILGEAVKRLPDTLRQQHPTIPWRQITGTRDYLSHGYDTLDYQRLWDAVQNDVPALLTTVEKMLHNLEVGLQP